MRSPSDFRPDATSFPASSWSARSAIGCSTRWQTSAPRRASARSRSPTSCRARVSREAFYEQFRDKEDCFLAAYDAILGQFLGAVIAAYEQRELAWPERVRAAIQAILSFLAAEPSFTRMTMVEVLAAGPQAHERYISAVRLIAALLDEGRAQTPNGAELPPRLATTLISGAALAIREQVWAGRTEELERLEPDLLYTTLGPFIGQAEALRIARSAVGRQP